VQYRHNTENHTSSINLNNLPPGFKDSTLIFAFPSQ